MRIFVRGIGLFFGAMLLQWWWNTHFSYWGAAPQFLLVLTILLSVRSNSVIAMLAGFGWGLYMDVARAELFGASAMILTLIAYTTSIVRRHVDLNQISALSVAALLLTVTSVIGHGFLGLLFTKSFEWSGWVSALATPLLNAVAIATVALVWDNRSRK